MQFKANGLWNSAVFEIRKQKRAGGGDGVAQVVAVAPHEYESRFSNIAFDKPVGTDDERFVGKMQPIEPSADRKYLLLRQRANVKNGRR